jgi:hypothetical protein
MSYAINDMGDLNQTISDIINTASHIDDDKGGDGIRHRHASALSRLMTRTDYSICDAPKSPRFSSTVHSRTPIGYYRTSGFGGCVDINSAVRGIKQLTGKEVECKIDTSYDESCGGMIPVLETVLYDIDDPEPELDIHHDDSDSEINAMEPATPLASDDESDELEDARVSYDALVATSSKRLLYVTILFRTACVFGCVYIASKLSLYCFDVISAQPM